MPRELFGWMVVVCFLFATGSVWGDLTDGLVGYWPLDGDGVDEGENGIDGTIIGDVMPTEDRFGNEDAALLFPGSASAYVDLGDHELFDITGAMTLAAWITLDPANGGNNGRIVSKQGGGGSRSWSLNTENAGVPATFQVAPDGGNIRSISDLEPIPQEGEWVHVAGVFRPGESMELYVDGELRYMEDFDIPDEHYSANGLPVLIGARNACGNCGWFGAIDEVAIWDRDLDEDEIIEVMESESLVEGQGPRVRATQSDGSTRVDEADPAATDTYTLVLTGSPPSPVQIDLAFDSEQIDVTPATLTFTSANFATAQTVTVSAVDDDEIEDATHTSTIIHTATGGGFNGETVLEVVVSILDNDPVEGRLTDGLVGYWPLDGDALDATGSGLDGVIQGNVTPAEDRLGEVDAALRFPGSSDSYVDLGDDGAFNMTGAMTLAAWVFLDPDNGDRNGRIVAKQGGGGQRSWSLNREDPGVRGTLQVSSDPNSVVSLSDLEPLPQGEWVHLAGVFRPGEMRLYVDGELRVSEDVGVPDQHFSDNGLAVLIGGRHACGNCAWLGAIDEVAIWKRALAEDEVVQVMESESLLDEVPTTTKFRRGDPDDNGIVNLTDAVNVLEYLFAGGEAPPCQEAGDANNDGQLDLSDAVGILSHLFADGPPPEAPGSENCGPDPDDGLPKMDDGTTLGCEQYTNC